MHEREGVAELQAPSEDLSFGRAVIAIDPIVQASTGAKLHDEEEPVVGSEMVAKRDHVRVLKLRKRLHFPDEVTVVVGRRSLEHFDSDLPTGDRFVVGQKHFAESPPAKSMGYSVFAVQSEAEWDHGQHFLLLRILLPP